jgi:uncharacterized protein YceK
MKRILCALMMTLLLSGCAAPINHNTASGKVETSFVGAKKSVVRERITNEIINRGYNIIRSDDSMLVADKPVENVLAAALLGSDYDSTPNARITFNLIQNGNTVRVVADCAVITNPGSAFERRTNANNNAETANIQSWLDGIKRSLQNKKK